MDTEEQRQARKEQESVNLERQDAERREARWSNEDACQGDQDV